MTRSPRYDDPGSWHHVINRGIARRTLFENAEDIRFFLSRLARATRRGDLELHAYSILTTHFHLLVRSPRGELSLVMRRVQNEYVRRFNRVRRRDGPLVRGRFRSKPVQTLAYRSALLRYIDDNPVAARLVDHPCDYPHGSAWLYARKRGPLWLERDWVEQHVRALQPERRFDDDTYRRYAGATLSRESVRWVEARMAAATSRGTAADPLDDLLQAAPARVLRWMTRKARLADGTGVGLPLVSCTVPMQLIAAERRCHGEWRIRCRRRSVDGWSVVQAALLRDLCACSFAEIAQRVGCSAPQAGRIYERHRSCLEQPEYAERTSALAVRTLAIAHGE